MKNIYTLLILSILTLFSNQVIAQCNALLHPLSAPPVSGTICAPATFSGFGAVEIGSGAGQTPCSNSAVWVLLQRRENSSSDWFLEGLQVAGYTSPQYNFTVTEPGQYRLVSSLNNVGVCSQCSGNTQVNYSSIYTINAPATGNFRVNGSTQSNPSFCETANVHLNTFDISSSQNYEYRVGFKKDIESNVNWVTASFLNGPIPTHIDIKSSLVSRYGVNNITGQYNFYLQVKNSCGGVHQSTKQARIVSKNISIVLQAQTTLQGGFTTLPIQSVICSMPYTQVCNLSTIFRADQTQIENFAGAIWSCKLEELDNCSSSPQLVFEKPLATLSSLNDLQSLNLASYGVLFGGKPFSYISDNSTTKTWKFTLYIQNSCNDATRIVHFRNINNNCKTDGISSEELESLSWNIYPNPGHGEITLEFDHNILPSEIEIFDVSGKRVFVELFNKNNNQLLFNSSSLNTGVYIVRYYKNNKYNSRKMIIQ